MAVSFYATIDSDSVRPQWMQPGAYLLPATSFFRKGFPTPTLPEGCDVALDCGGFVATRVWGEYRFDPLDYIAWAESIPNVRWAAMFDYCCEAEITGANDGVVRERQVWTAEMARRFLDSYGDVPWAWVPTLQGWTVADYLQAADDLEPLIRELQSFYAERLEMLYDAAGDDEPDPDELERLSRNLTDFRVGIGTLCNRKDVAEVVEIVEALVERLPGVTFHLWGVKLQALGQWPGGLPSQVVSVDSAAWNGRFGRDISVLNAEQRELGMSQRQYGYTVRLPRYLERFAAVTQQQRPAGVKRPIVERQLRLAM
jgi:hypothetical protein